MYTGTPTALAAASLENALGEVGQREDGTSNWGGHVTQYLKTAGINEPEPWCASFLYWSVQHAADKLGLPNPLKVVANHGYVQSYVDHAKNAGWLVSAKEAQAGDFGCIWHPSLNRYGHIVMLTGTNVDEGYYTDVEGNSNEDGSRDGYEVVHRRSDNPRPINDGVVFLRWSK